MPAIKGNFLTDAISWVLLKLEPTVHDDKFCRAKEGQVGDASVNAVDAALALRLIAVNAREQDADLQDEKVGLDCGLAAIVSNQGGVAAMARGVLIDNSVKQENPVPGVRRPRERPANGVVRYIEKSKRATLRALMALQGKAEAQAKLADGVKGVDLKWADQEYTKALDELANLWLPLCAYDDFIYNHNNYAHDRSLESLVDADDEEGMQQKGAVRNPLGMGWMTGVVPQAAKLEFLLGLLSMCCADVSVAKRDPAGQHESGIPLFRYGDSTAVPSVSTKVGYDLLRDFLLHPRVVKSLNEHGIPGSGFHLHEKTLAYTKGLKPREEVVSMLYDLLDVVATYNRRANKNCDFTHEQQVSEDSLKAVQAVLVTTYCHEVKAAGTVDSNSGCSDSASVAGDDAVHVPLC